MGQNVVFKTLKEIVSSWFWLFLILLAILLVVSLSLAGRGPFVTIQPKEGISVFAVSYLMAQFIERAVEPFSEITLRKQKKNEAKPEAKTVTSFSNTMRSAGLFSDTEMIKTLRRKMAGQHGPFRKGKLAEREYDEKLLNELETKRVIAFWGLTSLLGILLCYITVGLFEIVGVSFQNLAVAGRTITGHTFDSILSGMIVGGGTKPLHDLIGYIEKEEKTKT